MSTKSVQVLLVGFAASLTLAMTACNKTYDVATPPNMEMAMALRNAVAGDSGASSGAAAGPAVMAEPTGWATLKGRFTLAGDAPPPVQLNITGGDTAICAPGGKKVFSESLVVGSDGGIRDVLVYCTTKLDPAEPFTHPSAAPGDTGEVEFDQKNCVFLSHVFGMRTGQTLKILNSDPVGHNTNIGGTPINQIVAAGSFIKYTPKKEWKKPNPVSCSIHPWMSSNLIVRDNGYFAISDASGNFEIPNLPAGVELEFRIWQEAGTISGIEIDGAPVKKGRFTLTLPPGGTEFAAAVDASTYK